MDLKKKLTEAEYIHRGDDGPYLGGQCGFSCDHGVLVNNDDSGRPCYRMCKKLNIKVSDYDSCKYYCDDEFSALCQNFVNAANPKASTEKVAVHNDQQKKPARIWIWIVVAAIIIYLIFK